MSFIVYRGLAPKGHWSLDAGAASPSETPEGQPFTYNPGQDWLPDFQAARPTFLHSTLERRGASLDIKGADRNPTRLPDWQCSQLPPPQEETVDNALRRR